MKIILLRTFTKKIYYKIPLWLIVISIAAGAAILSYLNHSGFWLVNRYFGLDVKDALRYLTIMETIIALTGFTVVFVLGFFIQ